MPDIEDAKRHKMGPSGAFKKGSPSPSWLRTAKFVAVMVTILVLLGATDLPGSGSVKRLAAATGLTMNAADPGRRSLFAQKSSNAKQPDPFRTNERPKLTPEEEKRRKEVIKIYEEAKAEAAKEEKRKVAREAENAKRLEAERAEKAAKQAAAKAARKELAGDKANGAADVAQVESEKGKSTVSGQAEVRDAAGKRKEADSSKEDASRRRSSEADKSAADTDDKDVKQATA